MVNIIPCCCCYIFFWICLMRRDVRLIRLNEWNPITKKQKWLQSNADRSNKPKICHMNIHSIIQTKGKKNRSSASLSLVRVLTEQFRPKCLIQRWFEIQFERNIQQTWVLHRNEPISCCGLIMIRVLRQLIHLNLFISDHHLTHTLTNTQARMQMEFF